MIQNGADMNVKDKDGNTPLHIVCKEGYFNFARILVENDANVNIKNKERLTPYRIAYRKWHISICNMIKHFSGLKYVDIGVNTNYFKDDVVFISFS